MRVKRKNSKFKILNYTSYKRFQLLLLYVNYINLTYITRKYINLPELIFARRNRTVGMKLCVYNNHHAKWVFIKKFAFTSAFFSAYVSKNRYFSSFSLAAVNTSQFASLEQNMILIILHLQICSWRVKLSKQRKNLDFC